MNPIKRRSLGNIVFSIVTLFGVCGLKAAHSADNNSTLRLLVVPQFPATEIHATWSKVLKGIESSSVPKIELIFSKDIAEFESMFLAGQADLIYCNPYHMVMAKKSKGYVPLVRDATPMSGILISPKGGEFDTIKTLNDLNGKILLFPSPNAFGASLYMRALLTREKGLNFVTKYVKTHPNVIRGVVRNEGQAGGMVNATLLAEDPALREKVKVIYETPPAAPHPIAAHPRVDAATREAVSIALLDYLKQHKAEASGINMSNPMRANYNRDYLPLESLGLEEFVSN